MTLSAPSGQASAAHTVEIPPDLYSQLERVLENSRFSSVADFALYVLRDLASHPTRLEGKTDAGTSGGPTEEEPLTAEEIEIIQERLQNLGYL
jgi:Arc/MetJ-type ribon-helix-helix transcriptional regulator